MCVLTLCVFIDIFFHNFQFFYKLLNRKKLIHSRFRQNKTKTHFFSMNFLLFWSNFNDDLVVFRLNESLKFFFLFLFFQFSLSVFVFWQKISIKEWKNQQQQQQHEQGIFFQAEILVLWNEKKKFFVYDTVVL